MMAERRVRRSWDISKRTADSLNKLQLVSGIEKSDLVDISITLLFQTVIAVRACTGRSSREIMDSIARALPADMRDAEMQVESGPLIIDLMKLLQLFRDDPIKLDPSSNGNNDRQQTTMATSMLDLEMEGEDGQ